MVNIANLDFSADANLGTRQELSFSSVYISLFKKNQKSNSSDQTPKRPLGGPQCTPEALRGYFFDF